MKLLIAIASSVAVTALAFAVAALVIADRAQSPSVADAATPPPAAAAATLQVTLGDVFIEPKTLTAPTGAALTLDVQNHGAIQHDLHLDTGTGDSGPGTPLLDPHTGAPLDLGALEAGTYTLYCSVPGHRAGGMEATLTVAEGAAPTTGSGDAEAPHVDVDHLASMLAFPATTQGLGGQPLEPALDGDVKVFNLTAQEIQWEVEPGVFRDAMAYNGQVPGPEIRVQLGDRVRIVLHNELPEATSIHFHGLTVPNDQDGVPGMTQPPVEAGETYIYEFTTVNAGSHMYHSHMNGSEQVPMGLLGAFIVEDGTETPVDQDVAMILNDGPLGYTINGKGFPATQPVVAKQGDKIRIRYMNEGLQIHPMHLHGVPQLVVAKDGYPLPQPHYEDTVTVAPGERIDVIVDATEVGAWAFHCHILTHSEGPNGMFGMVTALLVE